MERKYLSVAATVRSQIIAWENLLDGDVGLPIELFGHSVCVQFGGSFGGGILSLEGSNDGINYLPLSGAHGVSLSKSTSSIDDLSEFPRYVRPKVSGGSVNTNLSIYLLVRS